MNKKSNPVYLAFEMLLEEIDTEINSIKKDIQRLSEFNSFTEAATKVNHAEQISSFRDKVVNLQKQWTDMLSWFKQKGKIKTATKKKTIRGRLHRGVKTPSKDYYRPILQALIDLGGKAKSDDVLKRVEKAMHDRLKPIDYEPLPSNPNETRWKNTAKWARKDMTMMKPPLLKPNSPPKIWEITETGRKFLLMGDQ